MKRKIRSLGTTPISGKTLSEGKGHSRSSRRVPGYSRNSSRNSKFHSRNTKSILGMASHDLSNTKTTILGATPGVIPGIGGNPQERFSFAPSILGAFFFFFSNIGGCHKASIDICKCLKLNTNFFLELFRHPQDVPTKSWIFLA